ncbi:MAG: flagellar basal-body rod protein FlgF [Alphaproteobacteria bacterium]|nr:flagellar basal-body rod protein FlgF [Alphaproteobacteria bacterium]
MENPSYIVLSHQSGLRRQMEVIANNLANMSTNGFKAERLMFTEYMVSKAGNPQTSGNASRISFVGQAGTYSDHREGPLQSTGNQLDMAIAGPGYFTVETPGGPRYSRDGRFELDGQGRIVNREGLVVLGRGGQALTVPQGATKVEVSNSGRITSDKGDVGELAVVKFHSDNALRKVGGNLFETDAAPQPVDATTRVQQNMIEASNVQSIFEISNMIELQRRYQASQRLLEAEHERARTAIQKLTRVSG